MLVEQPSIGRGEGKITNFMMGRVCQPIQGNAKQAADLDALQLDMEWPLDDPYNGSDTIIADRAQLIHPTQNANLGGIQPNLFVGFTQGSVFWG